MRYYWLAFCEIVLTLLDMIIHSKVSRLMLTEIQRVRGMAETLHKKPSKPAKKETPMSTVNGTTRQADRLSHATKTEFRLGTKVVLTVAEADGTIMIGDNVRYAAFDAQTAAALAHALLTVLGSRDGILLCTPGDESPWDQIMRDLRHIANEEPEKKAESPF